MFHWICPECGREIAPTVRECPACDPNAIVAEPALVGVVEAPTARAIDNVAPTVRAIGNVAPTARAIDNVAPPLRSLYLPKPDARSLLVVEQPPPSAEPILPQLDASPTGDPLQYLSALLEDRERDEREKPSEPPRVDQRFPISAPEPAVPPVLRAWIANLRPAAELPRIPVTGSSQAKPQAAEPPLVRSKIALPPVRARKTVTIPVCQPVASPAALPTSASKPTEPMTPYSGPAPVLAPLANYSPLAGRPMRPAVPAREVLKRDSGPRITLPGPMLTPRLVKFQDRELNPILPERRLVRKPLIPGWAASVLIVGTVLVAGFNSVFSIVPRSGGEVKASAASNAEAAQSVSAPAPENSNSLSSAIEVTGFRIQVDPAKKSEIQYLVVNHTPNPFSGVTVYVTLHAANESPGQPPLGKFQFGAPNLGPYESKEMSSAIERVNRPVNLPEWQDLRADVEIGQ